MAPRNGKWQDMFLTSYLPSSLVHWYKKPDSSGLSKMSWYIYSAHGVHYVPLDASYVLLSVACAQQKNSSNAIIWMHNMIAADNIWKWTARYENLTPEMAQIPEGCTQAQGEVDRGWSPLQTQEDHQLCHPADHRRRRIWAVLETTR
jgi:hypothetical protein